jgi:N-acetyl-anhydromuramyl-L-alanine amidase AmpD
VQVVEINHAWNGTLRPRTSTRRIIIHHAASAGDVSAATIHGWHLRNGWAGIGYHYVIRMSGIVERGRPENVIGAHAKDHNGDSIGICLAGNVDVTPPPMAQMLALVALIRDIWARHGQLLVIGHRDVNATTCPGRYFPAGWLSEQLAPKPIPPIQQRVGLVFRGKPVDGGGYLIEGTSHVPVRFLAESLGLTVRWQDGTVYVE